MKLKIKQMLAGPASSDSWNRTLLTIEGRTAADDLAEFSAGSPQDDGGVGVEEAEDGTLQGDLAGFKIEDEGYADEPPVSEIDDAPPAPHDYRKRFADTKADRDAKAAENAALKAQLDTLQRERMQPAQPHVLQPGQVDPLTQIDQTYQAQKKQLHQQTMQQIKSLNRQDPLIQDKIANLWAEHAEKLGEMDGDRRERKLQAQAQQQSYYQRIMDQETARALTAAGLDPVAHKDEFVNQVAILNFRQPGWDAGMSQSQTYDYVVEQLKIGGRAVPSQTKQTQTPYQQHQALRQGAKGSLTAGARLDPTKPNKKTLPEEKDVSWHNQLRQAKKARTVTEEQAMRMKIR